MPLIKNDIVTVIPAVPAVEGRAETTICTPLQPDDSGTTEPPVVPTNPEDARIYLYDNAGSPGSRTPAFAPAPNGYVCETGMFFLPDPSLPGGLTPVYETRCFAP